MDFFGIGWRNLRLTTQSNVFNEKCEIAKKKWMPRNGWHITSNSKCILPSLRIITPNGHVSQHKSEIRYENELNDSSRLQRCKLLLGRITPRQADACHSNQFTVSTVQALNLHSTLRLNHFHFNGTTFGDFVDSRKKRKKMERIKNV